MTSLNAYLSDIEHHRSCPPLPGRLENVALISNIRHLPQVRALQECALIVSTDWLAWKTARDQGLACLLLDDLFLPWPEQLGDPTTMHVRANEWMYDKNGKDQTTFLGVSLGKQFNHGVRLFFMHYGRTWHAVDRLMTLFKPRKLILFDLRVWRDLLDNDGKRALLKEAAVRHGALLDDRLDPPQAGDPDFPETVDSPRFALTEPTWKTFLRSQYAAALDWLTTRLGRLRGNHPVLLMLNWPAARALTEGRSDPGFTPALFAASSPKGLSFLLRAIRRGFHLVSLPEAKLDDSEREALSDICRSVRIAWQEHSMDPVRLGLYGFIEREVLSESKLEERALDVKRFRLFFKTHHFSRVVVGDSTNPTCRSLADTARLAGCPVDELLNGMFLTEQRHDSRCGDSFSPPSVTRMLSRGPCDEKWLQLTGAPLRCYRVGYPALAPLRRPAQELTSTKRALILPIYADGDDAFASSRHIFDQLFDVLKALKEFGCEEVRVKLHVGPPNLPYYEKLATLSGAKASVIKQGSMIDHLAWADFVVGPVNSGAFLETMAAGKPYFSFAPKHTMLSDKLIDESFVLRSADELLACLSQRQATDRDRLLEYFASFTSIPNSPAAFWRAMAEAA